MRESRNRLEDQNKEKRNQKPKNKSKEQKTVKNMVNINSSISIITLNVSDLNIPIRVKQKTRPNYRLSARNPLIKAQIY